MFDDFAYEKLDLAKIKLDERNPRIVTQEPLKTQEAILEYFFRHEDLASFVNRIATQGRNRGAEQPYVIKEGSGYVVVEGNTRIAAYKLLTGLMKPPKEFASAIPKVSDELKSTLVKIECSVAPDRDAMLPIMADAHFGVGDKSKWGYLGSRKAVYSEFKLGKDIDQLAAVFKRPATDIVDYILEYEVYLLALSLSWSPGERDKLLSPSVQFNPPIRFLQSSGHRASLGIVFDRVNLQVSFADAASRLRFQHLVKKLVIEQANGLKATSTYEDVFASFDPKHYQPSSSTGAAGTGTGTRSAAGGSSGTGTGAGAGSGAGSGTGTGGGSGSGDDKKASTLKPGRLFNYPVNSHNLVITKLMGEAAKLNCNSYPAASTALLRGLIEAILKNIVHDQSANPAGKMLSLETALDLCLSNSVKLPQDDKKILKEFKNHHLEYVNMGVHATMTPQAARTFGARDCIDQFIKRNA